MAAESLILNGLNISSGAFSLEALDLTPPPKKPEWAQAADSDGANLVRTPLFENRTITATIRIEPQASMNLALEKLGELVDQLQEAEKNPGGIPLEWTPANSSKTITFFVLTGAVTGIPIVNEGSTAGYFAAAPLVSIAMTAKPFGYGTEVTGAIVKNEGQPNLTITLAAIPGDVPAEGRLVVTDAFGQGYRYVEWGLEQRYYNAATKLLLDSEDMTPVGGTQSTALNANGAYLRAGATKGTIATTLLPEPTICANTGNLAHVGTFRVKGRVWIQSGGGIAENVKVRMSWKDGEGPLRANTWQTPLLESIFVEVDLGTVTLTPALAGTQKWFAQIEAYSTNNTTTLDILHVDMLTFVPVLEGYGKARAPANTAPGTIVAFDNFTTGTLSGGLNARTPAVGAAWATSGAATDWTVEAGKAVRRTKSDASPRFGVLGGAVGNASLVCVGEAENLSLSATKASLMGMMLRWVDSSNYAFAIIGLNLPGKEYAGYVQVGVKVAGVTTIVAEMATPPNRLNKFTGTFTVLLDGSLAATFNHNGSIQTLSGTHSAVATGGALASGKGGVIDENSDTHETARWFKSITIATLAAIPYCIPPGRLMQIRSDSAIALDTSSTYYGTVPLYRGSRFFVPQAGSAKRTSRILVKADRYDLEQADQESIGQAFTAQAFWTPRYHAIPR